MTARPAAPAQVAGLPMRDVRPLKQDYTTAFARCLLCLQGDAPGVAARRLVGSLAQRP